MSRLPSSCAILCIALFLTACSTPGTDPVRPGPGPAPRPLIAVMGAYGPELAANAAAFADSATNVSTERVNGLEFRHIRYAGHDLLLFPSGVSMVNAAMNTQLAIDRFHVTHVLFAGIAGGINPERHIGDVVIPERWHHHSEAAYLNPAPDGKGYVIPKYFSAPHENFGFIFPDHVWAIREGMDKPERQAYFAADPGLLDIAREAVRKAPRMEFRGRVAQVHVGGDGIAGPVFMDNREYRRWAFRVWKAECLDMESTAIAQVCWANRVPFLIIRSLSDLAGGQEGVNDADFTEGPVAQHASSILREVVRAIPAGR